MARGRWSAIVTDDLKNMEAPQTEKDHWKKTSIYKLPASLIDTNKNAYTPQTVSFGPYHYNPSHPMEEHKHRALLHFLKRCRKSVEVLEDAFAEVEDELKDSHTLLHSLPKEVTDVFLQMMILDGCFMLEILRTADHLPDDYAPHDPIFSSHGWFYAVPYIKRDMLLLENQLPMLVHEKLVAIEDDSIQDDGFVSKLILSSFSPTFWKKTWENVCMYWIQHERHPLEYNHRAHWSRYSRGSIMLPATGLKEAGITFKPNSTDFDPRLMDITFSRREFRLPAYIVEDITELLFLNLMAFERFYGAGNEVTSYIFLMSTLIDNAKDVELLSSKEIILSALGSDEAVVDLFRSLSKDLTVDPDSIAYWVHLKVCEYCGKPWIRWRYNIVHL